MQTAIILKTVDNEWSCDVDIFSAYCEFIKMTWFIKSTSIICQAKKEIRLYRVEAFRPAGRKALIKIIAFVKKKIDIIPFLD